MSLSLVRGAGRTGGRVARRCDLGGCERREIRRNGEGHGGGVRLIPPAWSRVKRLANQRRPKSRSVRRVGLGAACVLDLDLGAHEGLPVGSAALLAWLGFFWLALAGGVADLQDDQPPFLDAGEGDAGWARCGPCDGVRITRNAGSARKSTGPPTRKHAPGEKSSGGGNAFRRVWLGAKGWVGRSPRSVRRVVFRGGALLAVG